MDFDAEAFKKVEPEFWAWADGVKEKMMFPIREAVLYMKKRNGVTPARISIPEYWRKMLLGVQPFSRTLLGIKVSGPGEAGAATCRLFSQSQYGRYVDIFMKEAPKIT